MNSNLAAGTPDTLPACPATPNCVSSQSTDPGHTVEPLPYTGTAQHAMQQIRKAILMQPRTRLVAEEAGYLHAECRSLLFRFVDDVEVLLDPAGMVIHIRSASRTGHSDFGVNHRRVERIRKAFYRP